MFDVRIFSPHTRLGPVKLSRSLCLARVKKSGTFT
jgi:hypothetical protein